MSARYIVRLDDACPTMRREIWDQLEIALDHLGIHPIVGIIPNNIDPSMLCSEPDPDFWEKVRRWEKKGWSIALHGLHHTYHNVPADCHTLIPLHKKSEFVGLSLDEQRQILKKSWRIFSENGVKPSVFMAPSHTFDKNTLLALCLETNIRIVTDGHALFPFRDGNFIWIPQQLWRFRWMPFGIWTVCLHPNSMSPRELTSLIEHLKRFVVKIVPFKMAVALCNREKMLSDRIFALIFNIVLQLKR